MRLYGLIGYPLGHSFSANFFADKFASLGINDCQYRNFPIESIELIHEMISNNRSLQGFNITIPYKQQIIPLLHAIDNEAKEVGAVNCVKITPQGLHGYNTDVYGFEVSLREMIQSQRPKALVLGTGGASKAVIFVLAKLGIEYINISRTPLTHTEIPDNTTRRHLTYQELTPETVASHHLIINTTPLGTFPNVDTAPDLNYASIGPEHLLYDLVYNPSETMFMRLGAENGATTKNGLQMLIGQAERSWEIWNE